MQQHSCRRLHRNGEDILSVGYKYHFSCEIFGLGILKLKPFGILEASNIVKDCIVMGKIFSQLATNIISVVKFSAKAY